MFILLYRQTENKKLPPQNQEFFAPNCREKTWKSLKKKFAFSNPV
jgi:hypothetical protein